MVYGPSNRRNLKPPQNHSVFFIKATILAVLMYALYGHARHLKFKQKYLQYGPYFRISFRFLQLWSDKAFQSFSLVILFVCLNLTFHQCSQNYIFSAFHLHKVSTLTSKQLSAKHFLSHFCIVRYSRIRNIVVHRNPFIKIICICY